MARYQLEFTENEWEEIEALSFFPFVIVLGDTLTRPQWVALGNMALGKAQRIQQGAFGEGDEDMGGRSNKEWADQLRGIATKIFDKFLPGDGQV